MEIKFEQKNRCKETLWLCPLIPEILDFVLFYLVAIASGKVFSTHEKQISGVVHGRNPGVFPQHLRDAGHFTAYCIFYLGFFSSSENQHGICVASCIPDSKHILHKKQAMQCVHFFLNCDQDKFISPLYTTAQYKSVSLLILKQVPLFTKLKTLLGCMFITTFEKLFTAKAQVLNYTKGWKTAYRFTQSLNLPTQE